MPVFPVEDKAVFLFIGDSITDCGRRDQHAPLGEGYVAYFVDIATSRHPERDIRWINMGVGGNKITDLEGRWSEDVLRHDPDWLSVKIGINDVHHTLGGGSPAITPKVYADIYDRLLSRVPKRTRLVLIDPFYISTDRGSEVLRALPEYLEAVEMTSKKYGALRVRTHAMFQKQLEYRRPDHFCPEPVHPNRTGHMLIAHELWRAICTGGE